MNLEETVYKLSQIKEEKRKYTLERIGEKVAEYGFEPISRQRVWDIIRRVEKIKVAELTKPKEDLWLQN